MPGPTKGWDTIPEQPWERIDHTLFMTDELPCAVKSSE